jgi:hypothetical protein
MNIDKDIIEVILTTVTICGVYWKLTQRMRVLELKQDEQIRQLSIETYERKELHKLVDDSHKEVKQALDENTKAIIELKVVLDLIKSKFI